MAYATQADLITRYGREELAATTISLDYPIGYVDEDRVKQVLEDASAIMDSYLQRRYQLPICPVTPVLVRVCCQLARYDLATGSNNIPSDQIKEGHNSALSWLEDIGTGKATLDTQLASETSQSWSRITTRNTGMSAETLW